MTLRAKHSVAEIAETRCTIVENGATKERVNFLKKLLEFNGFKVLVAEESPLEESPILFAIGVTDLVFNPVIAVYEMSLKTPDGQSVSPDYWNQYSTNSSDEYWLSANHS